MNISIFGLGYVGAVTAGCLTKQGHQVVGVDVHPQKVDAFNQGVAPIIEPGLAPLFREAKANGLLRATLSCGEAVAATDVSIVCVGTPSTVPGELDLSFVRTVVREIGAALRDKPQPHCLVLRSTMLPGSTARLAGEWLTDLEAGGRLTIVYYPEFLREGSAVADFEHPSQAVVGTRNGARPPAELMRALFGEETPVVDWPTAELLKYACNAFHATKVAFANEIGRIGKRSQVDAHRSMRSS
jgi:GDP-mannose 6-dehydrogenase